MISRLTLLLKGKMLVAILGTLVVAGGGTTIAVAASGAKVSLPLVTQTSSSEHHGDSSSTGNSSDSQDSSHTDGQQAEGTISSIDSGHTSFKLTPEHGDAVNVVVNAQTEFEGGLPDFSGLKVGLHVEVTGGRQTDGSLLATKVEGQDENANDNQNENDNQDEHELNGTIMSIDATSSTFVLKLSDGSTATIAVSTKTEFDGDGDFQHFSDLKVGQSVEVEGNLQTNGTVAATKVHPEGTSSSSDGGGSNGSDNGGGSGSSGDGGNSGGSGSSGSGTNVNNH
jgi:lysyl-tRNA synthetase class II